MSRRASISTRSLLIAAMAFNLVAMGLAEVQRSALSDVNRDATQRTDQTLKQLQKKLDDLQWAIRVLQIMADSGSGTERLEARIASRLNEGKTVSVQFDSNSREDRTNNGDIRCGPGTQNGYLGVFVASQRYVVGYDVKTKRWTGTGPLQTSALDPKTGTCGNRTAAYGPKELGAEVLPGRGQIILWGASFSLKGLQIYEANQKVGTIEWAD
jgi:hypothetical protein